MYTPPTILHIDKRVDQLTRLGHTLFATKYYYFQQRFDRMHTSIHHLLQSGIHDNIYGCSQVLVFVNEFYHFSHSTHVISAFVMLCFIGHLHQGAVTPIGPVQTPATGSKMKSRDQSEIFTSIKELFVS